MNVHHLTAVLVRITGLILVLKSIELVVSMAMAGATNFIGQPGYVAFLTFQVMWLMAGILMLLYPTRVAGNLLPVAPIENQSQDDVSANALTHLILIAAGLYFLVDGIKELASFFTYWAVYMSQGFGQGLNRVSFWNSNFVGQIVSGFISLIAGLWLLVQPQSIANFIRRLRNVHPK